MIKRYRKGLIIITIGVVLIFSWLWTEGFGINPKYEYGNTIEKALNFWHSKGMSNIGLANIVSTVDIGKDEKLVFFVSTNNTLCSGLVKKKWNGKWVVIEQGGELPFDTSSYFKDKDKPALIWMWSNMKEFGVSFGIIFDKSVDKVVVGEKSAVLLNKGTNKSIWYFIDKTGSSYLDYKPNNNVKAFDENEKIIYSYYPQK